MTDTAAQGGARRAGLARADAKLAALQSDHPQLRAKLQAVRDELAAAAGANDADAAAPEDEAPPAEEADPTA